MIAPGSTRAAHRKFHAVPTVMTETLEPRQLLAVVRPDHVVVVIEQDRFSDAIGNANFAYLNSIAPTALVYTNSHGVTHPSEPNGLAILSGSTQGITDNGRNYSFSGPNLAKSLFDAGLSFAGFVENLPADGSQVTQAGDSQYPDLYTRNVNPMAQFTDAGTLPGGGARANAAINRTFAGFASIPTTDYSSLPTVSYVIPNNLHSTHGSNVAYPWAGSPDEQNNDILRRNADAWLRDNIDGYLQWAKTHNSLLVITQDEERWVGGTAQTVTTLVDGDPRLFVAGTNLANINHHNVLRTIEDMYGLPRLNDTAAAAPLDTDANGRLAPTSVPPPAPEPAATATALVSSANPSTAGQSVTFTATVTAAAGAATATGSVTFKDGQTILGTAGLDSAGRAVLATASLAAGPHSITASYGGDATHQPSASAALTQQVNSTPTTTAPPNDYFANRITLSGSSVTTTGKNVKATREAGEPNHVGIRGGRSVWWTWTAPAAGTVTIDTLGSNFDTLLAVYTGSSVSALTVVKANDDAGGGTVASKLSFAATPGRQYQIAVDGYEGSVGSITLHVNLPATVAAAGTFSAQRIQPSRRGADSVLS
jgi:hypothetical protein